MEAIVLAAGMGNRLLPYTDDCHKCLIDINGQRPIFVLLERLHRIGIKRVTIVTGYLSAQLEEFIGDNNFGINISYVHNDLYRSTDNLYAVWLASQSIAGNEGVLLIEADVIVDTEFIDLVGGCQEDILLLSPLIGKEFRDLWLA